MGRFDRPQRTVKLKADRKPLRGKYPVTDRFVDRRGCTKRSAGWSWFRQKLNQVGCDTFFLGQSKGRRPPVSDGTCDFFRGRITLAPTREEMAERTTTYQTTRIPVCSGLNGRLGGKYKILNLPVRPGTNYLSIDGKNNMHCFNLLTIGPRANATSTFFARADTTYLRRGWRKRHQN